MSYVKTSPISPSSSYGMYGAATVNPYASYFGPQQHVISSPPGASAFGPSNMTSPIGMSGHSFVSPSGSAFNPHSFGAATSPFTSPGNQPAGGGQQYYAPFSAQTRIIGGVNHNLSGGIISPSMQQQTPPRYYHSYGMGPSPGRSEDIAVEPMHYSPINYSGQGHSLGIHNSSPTNAFILPSYLLGLDQTHHHSHHQSGVGGSPPSPGGPGNSPVGASSNSRFIDPSSFMNPSEGYRRTLLFEASGFPDSENSGSGSDGKSNTKPAGPPIHGFGSSEGVNSKEFLESELMKESYAPKLDGNARISKHSNDPPPSGPATASGTWVTIFGFPGGASSFVLTNFSTCGKIVEVKSTPGSNWIHIRYSSKIEARRALSKNGKVLGGSIMVGVVNSDPKVIQEAEVEKCGNVSSPGTSQPATSPTGQSSILRERNIDNNDSIKSRIRPLATGSITPQSMTPNITPRTLSQMPSTAREAYEVERSAGGSGSLPSASDGIFTKAMEFMFGW